MCFLPLHDLLRPYPCYYCLGISLSFSATLVLAKDTQLWSDKLGWSRLNAVSCLLSIYYSLLLTTLFSILLEPLTIYRQYSDFNYKLQIHIKRYVWTCECGYIHYLATLWCSEETCNVWSSTPVNGVSIVILVLWVTTLESASNDFHSYLE